MDPNIVIGVVLIVLALGAMGALVLWSRRVIHRLNDAGHPTAREILRRPPRAQ